MKLTPIIIVIIIALSGCKNDKVVLDTTNHLKDFSKVKTQIFELSTVSDTMIKGNKGTKFYYERDAFDINSNDNVTVELREYYNLNELIYNNINTVTDKNELLETSGVIYLDFKVDDKSIELKSEKELIINFPVKTDYENRIYKAQYDSIGKISWSEKKVDILFTTDIAKHKTERGVMQQIIVKESFMVPIDSLDYYREKFQRKLTELKRIDSIRNVKYLKRIEISEQWENLTISINQDFGFGYINVDKVIDFDKKIDFDISIQNKKLDNISFYVLYDNLNSFLSFFRTTDDLSIGEIPVIYGETEIIAVSEINNEFFAQKIRLTKELKDNLELKLKKMEFSKIKDLINQ